MSECSPPKWRHFEGEIILLCARWYLRYALSYRDLEEMMGERGLAVDYTTIFRWVQRYAPELEMRCRPFLKPTNDSYRVDETYIKVKGRWKYLYRAVDSKGNTIDFLLRAKCDTQAAKQFFRKALEAFHTSAPRVINVDGNCAYPSAFEELKNEGVIPETRAWVLEVSESDRRAGSHIHQEAYTAWSGIRVFPHRLANLVGLRVHEHDS